MTVGESIRKVRKRKGFTQAQLADALGISYVGISQYERGERNPKIGTLLRIAEALGVDIAEITPLSESYIKSVESEAGLRERLNVEKSKRYSKRMEALRTRTIQNKGERIGQAYCLAPERDQRIIDAILEPWLNDVDSAFEDIYKIFTSMDNEEQREGQELSHQANDSLDKEGDPNG